MRRYLVVIAVAALLLVGCSSSGNTAPTATAGNRATTTDAVSSTLAVPVAKASATSVTTLQPFTFKETAYTITPSFTAGEFYLQWTAIIENPNDGQYGQFPVITVTARDDAGAVVGTGDQTLFDLPPHLPIGFSSQVTVHGTANKVEFTAGKTKWQLTKTAAADYPPFAAKQVALRSSPDSGWTVTGDITNPYKLDTELAITALLRDTAGKLIGGYTTFTISVVPAGASHPFDMHIGEAKLAAASVDISAIPWGGTSNWNQLATAP